MKISTSFLLVLFALLPCLAIAGEADDLTEQGYDALIEGKYDVAVEMFLAAVEKEKNHARANTGLLKLYLLVGDYKQAAENAASLAARKSATAQMVALGADACANTGQYEKALEFYRKGMALDGSNVHSLLGAGRMLSLLGKGKESEQLLEKARTAYLSGSDHTVDETVCAAAVCVELNRYAEANSILGDAIKKDPEHLGALNLRGKIFLEKYDYPEAKKFFDRALEINAKHPETLTNLAWLYSKIGELGPERYSKARSFARKALRTNRTFPGAHIYLAYSELTDSNYDRAQSYLKKALKANPQSVDVLVMLAAIHKLRVDQSAYESTREKVFKLEGAKAEFLCGVASVLQAKFRYQEALDLALAALKADEKFWPAYAVVGLNMLRLGKEKEAKKYLETSRENDGFNIWTYNSLQLLMHMNDNFKQKKTPHFVIKAHGAEFETLAPYVERVAEWSYKLLSAKYKFKPKGPILIELFRKHKYFSARTVGLPGIPASGACFGPLVTMDSPSARRAGTYNWAKTLHHELAHVFTLQRSKNRISHWFTEGLSVYEEKDAYPHWARNMERAFIDALSRDAVTPIAKLERKFNKPRSGEEILGAYYQSSLIVEYIVGKFSFDKVLAIIDAYAEGKTDSVIFRECLGVEVSQLDADFLKWAKERFGKFNVAGRITATDVPRLQDGAEFEPDNAALSARLARAYLAAGKVLDSETCIKRALRLDASSPEALLAQAALDMHQGFSSSAKENYLKAVAAGLENTYDVHIVLAQLYFAEDKKEEAIEHLKKALSDFDRDGSASSPYRILYNLYKRDDQEDKAFEMLEKVVALSDTEFQGRVELADRHLGKHEYEEAAALLRQVIHLSPLIPGIHERLGDALRGEEEIDEAIFEYKTAIVVGGPDQADAYAGLAQCYFEKEDMKQAEANARKAIELDPQHQLAREVLELLGKWSE